MTTLRQFLPSNVCLGRGRPRSWTAAIAMQLTLGIVLLLLTHRFQPLASAEGSAATWKTEPPAGLLDSLTEPPRLWRSTVEHWLVRFEELPASSRLREIGLQALGPGPADWLLVESSHSDWWTAPGLRQARPVSPGERWSPAWEPLPREGPQKAAVEFFRNLYPADARDLLLDRGLTVLDHPQLPPHQWLVEGTITQLRELTAYDAVAYVWPASSDLADRLPIHACAGASSPSAITASGFVGQVVSRIGEGWDGPGLGAARLQYVLSHPPAPLSAEQWATEIRRALETWSSVIAVDFVPASDRRAARTLDIFAASGEHGDGHPFDGPRGTLGHTFYPTAPEPLAGDIHLDADEPWRVGTDTDLYSVALHEAGHALGLGHSDLPGAVMYPYYRRVAALTAADIEAVTTLYATRSAPPDFSLSLLEPASGQAETSADRYRISGSLIGAPGPAVVTITAPRGSSSQVVTGTSWSAEILLAEGVNPIEVQATSGELTARVSARLTRAAPAAAPTLSLHPHPASSREPAILISGLASHPDGIREIRWQSPEASGVHTPASPAFSISVPLLPGLNPVTFTAVSHRHTETSVTTHIRLESAAPDTVRPSLRITQPASGTASTSSAAYTLRGEASDDQGLAAVRWSAGGRSGPTEGLTAWSASIPLVLGINQITVLAEDISGNTTWRSVTVTRR